MIRWACLIPALCGMTGCSPGYVLSMAAEQISILSSREEISDVLKDGAIDTETKNKLVAVRDAREFGKTLGLTPNDSFTTYAKIDRDVLSWIVMGAKKESFEMVGWWFPIIGTVPYKGFFEKEDADEFAKSLEKEGYEVWVRPTDAYSTLGWFNDPILSTTLKRSEEKIVETVLHETFHQTVWFPSEVAFNETAANMVGLLGAIQFYKDKSAPALMQAEENLKSAFVVAEITNALYDRLKQLYDQNISGEEKLAQRDILFQEILKPYREKYPNLPLYKTLNNAEIMQLRIYFTHFKLFSNRRDEAGSLPKFIEYLKEVKKNAEENSQTAESVLEHTSPY